MSKLTLAHLCGYLPYGLKVSKDDWNKVFKMDTDGTTLNCVSVDYVLKVQAKPLLRPMSDLISPITVNGKTFVPMYKLKNGGTNLNEYRFLDWKGYSVIDNEEHETCYNPDTKSFYRFYRGESRMCANQLDKFQKLYEWHFDIWGLLDAGLAIDLNKVNDKEPAL